MNGAGGDLIGEREKRGKKGEKGYLGRKRGEKIRNSRT
jgi:hypothetical protein